MANRAAGKGYENVDNYDNIRFKFIGIENIHVMRSSLQKLLEGMLSLFDSWPLVCGHPLLISFASSADTSVLWGHGRGKRLGESILMCSLLA